MLWFLAWYVAGVVGCVFGCARDIQNGGDFTLGDLVTAAFGSLIGPIMLVMGFFYWLPVKGSMVLIKGKNQ